MTVYVDPIFEHGIYVGLIQGRSCHMLADSAEELHAFAQKLGLRREAASDYTQPNSDLHYDLTPGKRELAVQLGAREITFEEVAALLTQRRSERRHR